MCSIMDERLFLILLSKYCCSDSHLLFRLNVRVHVITTRTTLCAIVSVEANDLLVV